MKKRQTRGEKWKGRNREREKGGREREGGKGVYILRTELLHIFVFIQLSSLLFIQADDDDDDLCITCLYLPGWVYLLSAGDKHRNLWCK